MTLLSHLLFKDFRAVRLQFAAVIVLAPLIIWWPWFAEWTGSSDPPASLIFIVIGHLAVFQRTLLRLDAPDDPNRFLGTRPLSGGMILLSKATLMIGAGVLPISLALVLHLALAGMHLTVMDLSQLLLENSILLTAILCPLALAMGLRTLSWWLRVPLFIAAMSLLPWSNVTLTARPVMSPVWYPIFAFQFGLAATAAAAFTARYVRLSLRPALILCATVGIATGLLAFFGLQPAKPTTSTLPIDVISRGGLSASSHHSTLEIRYDCRLDGLPEGVYAEQTGWTSDLKIEGHPYARPSWLVAPASAPWVVPPEIALAALPGKNQPPASAPNQSMYLRLAMAEAPTVKKGDLIRVTLRGVQHFDLFRAELAHTVPFTDGGVWSGRGVRLRFDKIVRAPNLLKMEVETATIHLGRQDTYGNIFHGMGDFGFFAADLPSRQLFQLDSVTQQITHPSFHRQSRSKALLRIPLNPIGSPKSKPPPGPAQVTLAVFRRTKIGEVHVPFEFVNIELKVD